VRGVRESRGRSALVAAFAGAGPRFACVATGMYALGVTDAASFQRWAETAETIRATTKRLEKRTTLAEYLRSLDEDSLGIAARFFSGVPFARHDARTTQVGPSLIFDALTTVTGAAGAALGERYVAHGDAGDLAGELFAGRPPGGLSLRDTEELFARLATVSGTHARRALVRELYARLGAVEARFLTKLVGGELRIGLKEAQVEDALAAAFAQPIALVRRANLLRGDIGEVAQYAQRGTLAAAELALFHPIGFMLAQPLPTAEAIVAALPAPFAVEHKYDGIRAQAHVAGGKVALFSRTLDEITAGYPDVVAALAVLGRGVVDGAAADADSAGAARDGDGHPALAGGVVLDGELLAYDPDAPERALPFKALQQRLGRRKPAAALLAAVPVTFVAYDILAAAGALVIDEPYDERRRRLESFAWRSPGARLAPMRLVGSVDEVEELFVEARNAGNEGLMAKDPASVYAPGRRGKTWIKLKRPLATLDVVVTAAERGHGKRHRVLSDYTFAVRASERDPTLLNVGKAYNGLTDAEIAALTTRFEALTVERHGGYHVVRPEVVLEVTFDIVQPSERHEAGYALRFPRILRVRDDKSVAEIDTLARVRELAGEADAGGGDSPAEAEG